MKKIAICFLAIFLSLTFLPLKSNAATTAVPTSLVVSKPAESTKAKVLLSRLNEINAMDKSNLKRFDKQNLRKEVRSIKNQLNSIGGGVYLSVGAVLIIVLVLLILL